MTATYSTSVATDKDRVRLLLGDTDTAAAIFQDEEIAASLATYGDDVTATSAALADAAAAKYSRRVTMSVDGLSTQWSDLAAAFRALATRLRQQAAEGVGALAAPVVTGVSIAAMDGIDDDTDRPPSAFKVGMHDDDGADLADDAA